MSRTLRAIGALNDSLFLPHRDPIDAFARPELRRRVGNGAETWAESIQRRADEILHDATEVLTSPIARLSDAQASYTADMRQARAEAIRGYGALRARARRVSATARGA